MPDRSYLIGIDIGTTSTKAVLFQEDGTTVAEVTHAYPLYTPTPDVAEQKPEEIWSAVVTAVRSLMDRSQIEPAQILCLALGSAMHSIIAVDAAGNLLTNSLTWADNRSAEWAERLRRDPRGSNLYHRTGVPIHSMSPLTKLLWLRHEQPDIFHRAAKFISIKEFVLFRLCQQYVVDYAIASATGLLNLKNLAWDAEALELASISDQQLSQLVPVTHVVHPFDPGVAAQLGLATDTAIVVGASDGALANLSVGAMTPDRVTVTVGTSGAVRAIVKQPWTDPQQRLFCYALMDDYWLVGGSVNSGGIVWQWAREQFSDVKGTPQSGGDPYEGLWNLANSVAPGANGVLFHPYLAGERAPIWTANASGSFIGLTLRHSKAHLVRSLLEGIALNLNLVLQALKQVIGEPTFIVATGGMARSPLWRQLLADVTAHPVQVPTSYGSSCWGAAIVGLYALGRLSSLEAGTATLGASKDYQPNPENVAVYQKIVPVYAGLLERLQSEYHSIAQLQADLAALHDRTSDRG
ncbi:gluconate kinase [Leptolyngbya sp. FACHB-36]|uniref:gluconokinase n=1 Tax=Leptolyngbya sp. FACHB-36 TaxID=2692808 RepID=UPI001680B37C|nr:FGGY family carbohydrate kinase [Leptolyngbya sp. FACHB-36]MBD2020160.1 gluconate kinase [Leptolyngbya sp. FACHB-36]